MLLWSFAATAVLVAKAGPPFATDDPEPVDFQHWEVYFGTQFEHDGAGSGGTLPQVEVNYGLIPNLQVHLIAPFAFDAPAGGERRAGYGDTELGAKFRILGGEGSGPQLAVFPLVELPTGSASRGLGSGHTQMFLPVWFQQGSGPWTTYGGGGYWVNPGLENRNWWFAGWLLQRQMRPDLALGLEIYHETAQTTRGVVSTRMNLGLTWDLDDIRHVLLSAGPALQGPAGYQAYLAFQLTFGPAKPPAEAAGTRAP